MSGPFRVKPDAVREGFAGEPAGFWGSRKHELPGDASILMGAGPLNPRPVQGEGAWPRTGSE